MDRAQGKNFQGSEATPPYDSERIRQQLRRWQERLLDLTKANPLLGINRSRVSKLRITEPSPENLFNRFVIENRSLRMPMVVKKPRPVQPDNRAQGTEDEFEYVVEPGDVSFDAKPEDLLRRLRRIYDNARSTVEERGVTTLYLNFGVLQWEDPTLGLSVSPLWLVPCQLENHGPSAPLQLNVADEEMQLNPALELFLRERQHVTLPPIPDEPTPHDLASFLQAVRSAVRQQRWTVDSHIWLSTYTFESLVIYQDLKAMTETALSSDIVAALSRATDLPEASEALDEEKLDNLPEPVPTLPTDSSQFAALVKTAGGRNLVVHGPPGTGKSQTITNIIADALGRNQKVLFVSAKMAALNVVFQRLAKLGLDRFCLEAHSTKAGKTKIIEELKRSMEATQHHNEGVFDEHLEDLIALRKELNDYVIELHKRRDPIGRSIYQAIGRIEKLCTVADIRAPIPWNDVMRVERSDLNNAMNILSDLGAQAKVFDSRNSHPWRGLILPTGNMLAREAVESALGKLHAKSTELFENLLALTGFLGESIVSLSIDQMRTLGPSLQTVSEVEKLPSNWTTASLDELRECISLFENAHRKARVLPELVSDYEKVSTAQPQILKELLSPVEKQFRGRTRWLRPSYWAWRRAIRPQLKDSIRMNFASLCNYFTTSKKLVEIERWFEQRRATIVTEVGDACRGGSMHYF